jgi:hypothetical protein
VSDQPPSGPDWTPPQPPPPEGPGSWPPPPPPQQPPTQQWGPPPPGYQPYGQYGQPYSGAYAPRRTEGNAIAALVLALVSLPLLIFCGLGVVTAILGLVFSHTAKRNIAASNGALEGAGMVTAARVISWVVIALGVVVGILLIIGAIVGAFDESSSYGG